MNKPNNTAAADALADRRDKLVDDVTGVVHEATGLLESYGTQKLDRAKATLAQARSALAGGAKDYADKTDDFVHSNPWTSLGVVAAAGVLIGILLARR